MKNLVIRDARPEDGPGIGRVHVESWQSTYGGIVPQSYLDGLDPVTRGENWQNAISRNPEPTEFRRLVAEIDGKVVGFALVAEERTDNEDSPSAGSVGELFMIYTLAEVWGKGVGPKLMAECVQSLSNLGFKEAVLWVASENARARRFYEREGWSHLGVTRVEDLDGNSIPESQYRTTLD